MPKLIDVVKTLGGDAKDYFTKNAGINGTTAVTVVGAPELINIAANMSAGVDMSAALTAGGWTGYAAMAYYLIRFAVYLIKKVTKEPEPATEVAK